MLKRIYLSKNGKTFGPFSEAEIDEFRKKEELNKFQWILHDLKQGWKPIGAPPPLPAQVVEEPSISSEILIDEPTPSIAVPHIQSKISSKTSMIASENTIAALCHHREIVLSGTIKDVNAE